MKYYKFNISDFNNDTRHLNRIERSVYRDLLDLYYDLESPLPNDIDKLAKLILARDEKDIIPPILKEYFYLEEGYWRNSRCDKELGRVYEKSEKARASAEARWAKQEKQNANAMRTHSESDANGMLPITQDPLPKTQKDNSEISAKSSPVPFEQIKDLYHSVLPELSRVQVLTDKRKGQIRQRWQNGLPDLETWEEFFKDVRKSDFLMGRVQGNGRRPFRADLEWLTKESNFVKIWEGKYHG